MTILCDNLENFTFHDFRFRTMCLYKPRRHHDNTVWFSCLCCSRDIQQTAIYKTSRCLEHVSMNINIQNIELLLKDVSFRIHIKLPLGKPIHFTTFAWILYTCIGSHLTFRYQRNLLLLQNVLFKTKMQQTSGSLRLADMESFRH